MNEKVVKIKKIILNLLQQRLYEICLIFILIIMVFWFLVIKNNYIKANELMYDYIMKYDNTLYEMLLYGKFKKIREKILKSIDFEIQNINLDPFYYEEKSKK